MAFVRVVRFEDRASGGGLSLGRVVVVRGSIFCLEGSEDRGWFGGCGVDLDFEITADLRWVVFI